MKIKLLTFLFIVAIVLMIGSASATDYYASPTGSDSNDGLSTGAPFLSVQVGIDALSAGDTLYLMDGTWYDNESNFYVSGTAGNLITITNYSGAFPHLLGDSSKRNTTDYIAFDVQDESYITISNIEVSYYMNAVKSESETIPNTNVTIDNMHIHDVGTSGIWFNGYHVNCTISNNHLHDNVESNMLGLYGTYSDKANGTYTHNCNVVGNTLDGFIDHSAIDLFGDLEYINCSYNTVVGNQIYFHTTPGTYIQLQHCTFIGNIVYDSPNNGIKVLANYSYFSQNNLTNITSDSFTLYGSAGGSYHNIIENNYVDSAGTGYDYRIYGYNNTFINNTGDGYVGSAEPTYVINPVSTIFYKAYASLNYSSGKAFSGFDSEYYPSGSYSAYSTTGATVTSYDLYLVPSTGYLGSLSGLSHSSDEYSFTISASEDDLSTHITAGMNESDTEYTISIGGEALNTTTSDSEGIVSFTESLSSSAQLVEITQAIAADGLFIGQIATGSDDAWESGTNSLNTADTTVNTRSYTTIDSNYQCGGYRFQNVSIPVNATITNAFIRVYVGGATYDDMNGVLYADNVADSPTFSDSDKIISRSRTSNSTPWVETGVPVGWSDSPDISSVVQEVINNESWTEGNNLTILSIANTDISKAFRPRSYEHTEGGIYGAKLYVYYTLPESESETPLSVLSYTPTDLTPSSTNGSSQTFTATFNKTVDSAEWLIDGEHVEWDNSTTIASYTNSTAHVGTYNVTVIGTVGEESVQQTWTWTVGEYVAPITELTGWDIHDGSDSFIATFNAFSACFALLGLFMSYYAFVKKNTQIQKMMIPYLVTAFLFIIIYSALWLISAIMDNAWR